MADESNQLMTPQQQELYEHIWEFSFDLPGTEFTFCQRLAKENGWSLEYAQRVIDEYRKFVFLAVVAGHTVTPSKQVDQVWHLHLTYTKSYWEEFCPQVLQTPLHHDPTMGGQEENEKYQDCYSKTLDSYQQFFGIVPPSDIWSSPKLRFGRDLQFKRVNTGQNWIVPKLQIINIGIVVILSIVFTGFYVGTSINEVTITQGLMLTVIFIITGIGLLNFTAGVFRFHNSPKNSGWSGFYSDGGFAGCGNFMGVDSHCGHGSDCGGCSGGCGGCGGCGG